MYLAYYNLKEIPFQISPDPKFIWLGENHEEALAILEYGILFNKGFLLMTGNVGTGKTTLINALIQSLGEDTLVATIYDPNLEVLEFFNVVATAFNMGKTFESKGQFIIHFRKFLNKAHEREKKVLLIIDEAQAVGAGLLEEIRLLSNIERWDTKLLNIFFVGQNEFIDIISDTNNRALKNRIAINYHLDPLKESEIEKYILYRLKVAGHEGNIFGANVIDGIFSFSKGCPRLINIICDHALLTGYERGEKIINAEIIKECIDDFILPIKRNDDDKKKPESLEEITHEVIGEPTIKSSGTKVKFIVLSMLSLIIFSLLYYSDKFGEYIGNSEKYIRKSSNSQAKLTSTDMPQIGNPISTKVRIQEGHLDETYKLRQDPKLLSILSQKNVINFGHNLNNLLDEDFEKLERITTLIAQYPNVEIIIKGYTDSQGNYSYNKNLSKLRANRVKSFFVGKGISPSRIKTFGMGSENPIRSNKTLEGRRLNRRVEIGLNVKNNDD